MQSTRRGVSLRYKRAGIATSESVTRSGPLWGQADGVLESSSLTHRIAEYNQQKAKVKIISLEECQELWDNSLGPLLPSQGQYSV